MQKININTKNIESIDFIILIQIQLFLAKSKTKVYIQKLMNKEIKTHVIKKEKARFMLAFFHFKIQLNRI
jgi:hypothetical protein